MLELKKAAPYNIHFHVSIPVARRSGGRQNRTGSLILHYKDMAGCWVWFTNGSFVVNESMLPLLALISGARPPATKLARFL